MSDGAVLEVDWEPDGQLGWGRVQGSRLHPYNVMVYRLVAKGTIEEKVMAMKARKAALFASVVGGGGFESGALTAADIRRLLD